MKTHRHTTHTHANPAPALAFILTLIALGSGAPPFALATEDHFDLPGDTWGAPFATDSLRIVINVPARRLALIEGNTLIKSYPVAVGRPWTQTPRGHFEILQKAKDPTWAPKGRPAVPPGPGNPLGHRWMRISPTAMGSTRRTIRLDRKVRSHGCIRMLPRRRGPVRPRPGRDAGRHRLRTRRFAEDGQPVHFADVYGTDARAAL
jgi:hypothetical protein